MLREMIKTVTQFARGITVASLTAIANITLYLMGRNVAKELKLPEALCEINGGFCAGVTYAFAIPFNNSQIDAIPRQWKIANKRGKAFILLLCTTSVLTAGTGNSYFLVGDEAFNETVLRVIAFLLPSVAAEAIASKLLTQFNLVILRIINPKKYKKVFEAASILSTTIYNAKTNKNFSANLKYARSKASSAARSLIDAEKFIFENGFIETPVSQDKLYNAIEELKLLVNDKEEKIIVTGPLFQALKYLVGGCAGAAAGYLLFIKLGPKAASCIYGSLFDFQANSMGEIVCANKSEIGAQIGNGLGYGTLFFQSLILIYPIYELLELARASLHNKKSLLKIMAYFIVAGAAVLRASIPADMALYNTKENPNLPEILYVSGVVFLLQFFSMAINGPATLSILYNTCVKPIGIGLRNGFRCIQSQFSGNTQEDLEEEDPLLGYENPTAGEAAVSASKLLDFLKFRPGEASKMLEHMPEAPSHQHSTITI